MKHTHLKTLTFLWLLAFWHPANAQVWEILDPLPEGTGRYCCHFVDAQNGWVFRTGSHQLLRTRDGGSSWTELYPMTGMRHIFMADTSVGYMIVQENELKLFKTTDGGNNWQINSVQFYYDDDILFSPIKPIFFIDKNIGFVATLGTYLKTTDGGNSWIEMELPYNGSVKKVHNIAFIGDSVGWIAASLGGMEGKLFYTTDQGVNWLLLKDWLPVVSELDVFNTIVR